MEEEKERGRFGWLLAALVAMLVLFPFMETVPVMRSVLFSLVLVAGVYVVVRDRTWTTALVTLAVLALLAHWGSSIYPVLVPVGASLACLFLGLNTGLVLRHVFAVPKVTGDTLRGAVCGYLLIGVGWVFAYLLCLAIDPSAFGPPEVTLGLYPEGYFPQGYFPQGYFGGGPITLILDDLIYFSFTTLTTLGYGDITPASGVARTLAYLEAVVGQIYLVVLVAQLVGKHISQSEN